ncbi:hypothetical protein phiPsa374_129 [Pseudomonas phage phiPsa374]|uniref:Uncharacterized protein n=2 Tax=Otagovirus TaxID=2560197 RepID=A0A7G9V2Z7_9CAUD|nr:hypothetical protein CF96_gp091 [Pseudomonas phage phiPsa374]YP_010767394.1 hypothetical protein QGX17_gp093 [Pseudomonas phage phiPsa381]AHJ87389.1 hypothetical protein phiPsa374_129 [Pseudomonas phage phiPsa374]QNO00653.1 hypothetical protein phiPsa381_131 [Pseudomonas phage phiPsa381]
MKPFKVEAEYTFTVRYNKEKFTYREARGYPVTEILCDAWQIYGRVYGIKAQLCSESGLPNGVLEIKGSKKAKTAEAAMYVLERFRKFENWEEV